MDRARRLIFVTNNVSPSLRNSRHCFSAGRPVSTPELFLEDLIAGVQLFELNVEALSDAAHSRVANQGHLPVPFLLRDSENDNMRHILERVKDELQNVHFLGQLDN